MSFDSHYNIVFKEAPTFKRLKEIRGKLINIMGASSFSQFSNEELDYLLIPCSTKGADVERAFFSNSESNSSPAYKVFQIEPYVPDYSIGYEKGTFWIHYILIKFFLAQKDVKAVYKATGDTLGESIDVNFADSLLQHFISNGYSDS